MTKNSFAGFLKKLGEHCKRLESKPMADMFADDPDRFLAFSLCLEKLVFDYSKNRIDQASFDFLIEMAKSLGIEERRESMFRGDKINSSEKRAALHVALRGSVDGKLKIDGLNVARAVEHQLKAMQDFAGKVRAGEHGGAGGKITDVVNIGIGGSHTGPMMAANALAPYCDGPRLHFVSNVDGADVSTVLEQVNAETTLFIVASKTFTTAETMMNAVTARDWLVGKIGKDNLARHFVALSTNLDATRAFGIEDEMCFSFWDWVGGRYSVWSAIGLSLMIGIGPENFSAFLEGARKADQHFLTEPLEKNIPVIMGLLGVWYRNGWGFGTHAVLPYDQRLSGFPVWLQQLDMESNGKSVDHDGKKLDYKTAPVIFGEPGTNGQHAFYQLLHQGSEIVPCDFLVAANADSEVRNHQFSLVANCLAQSEALMRGKDEKTVLAELKNAGVDSSEVKSLAPQMAFGGNRPSNTIMYERLDPETLGMILALYEHKIFVQGAIWNINSFDQWGVELGKQLAGGIERHLDEGDDSGSSNSSTAGLVRAFTNFRKN